MPVAIGLKHLQSMPFRVSRFNPPSDPNGEGYAAGWARLANVVDVAPGKLKVGDIVTDGGIGGTIRGAKTDLSRHSAVTSLVQCGTDRGKGRAKTMAETSLAQLARTR